jgi:hypothetical protein
MKPIKDSIYFSIKTSEPFKVINVWQRSGEWSSIDIVNVETNKVFSLDYSDFLMKFKPTK